jgi:hypothetical protein
LQCESRPSRRPVPVALSSDGSQKICSAPGFSFWHDYFEAHNRAKRRTYAQCAKVASDMKYPDASEDISGFSIERVRWLCFEEPNSQDWVEGTGQVPRYLVLDTDETPKGNPEQLGTGFWTIPQHSLTSRRITLYVDHQIASIEQLEQKRVELFHIAYSYAIEKLEEIWIRYLAPKVAEKREAKAALANNPKRWSRVRGVPDESGIDYFEAYYSRTLENFIIDAAREIMLVVMKRDRSGENKNKNGGMDGEGNPSLRAMKTIEDDDHGKNDDERSRGSVLSTDPDPSQNRIRIDLKTLTKKSVARLLPIEREVLVRRLLRKEKLSEIEACTGLTTAGVNKTASLARGKFRIYQIQAVVEAYFAASANSHLRLQIIQSRCALGAKCFFFSVNCKSARSREEMAGLIGAPIEQVSKGLDSFKHAVDRALVSNGLSRKKDRCAWDQFGVKKMVGEANDGD